MMIYRSISDWNYSTPPVEPKMPKRKREPDDDSVVHGNESAKRERRAQGRRLERVLERSKQTLCKALKLARGFERQKLGRRQKTAKAAKDDGDSKRLAAEVEALKVCYCSTSYLAITKA